MIKLTDLEPNASVRNFEITMRLLKGRTSNYYLEVEIEFSKRKDTHKDTYSPISRMIDRISVCDVDDDGNQLFRYYNGMTLYLASYLSATPETHIRMNSDTVTSVIELPLVVIGMQTTHITIAFRDDNGDNDLVINRLLIRALPCSKSTEKQSNGTLTYCLMPGSTQIMSIRDIRVLCAMVWYFSGCSIRDVGVEIRDGARVICNSTDWIGYDVSETEFVLVCWLPFIDTTERLRIHILCKSIDVIQRVDTRWIAIHAPEDEGWVHIEKNDDSNGNGTETTRGWLSPLTLWSMPKWYNT